MIHLNVVFLVIRSTSKNIVKILINASPHAVNKLVHEQRTFPCMYCYNMAGGMHHVKTVYERVSTYNPQR